MGEAEDANALGAGECVERRSLHFDGKNAFVARGFDGFGGLAKGASVVQLAPTTQRGPISPSAAAAVFTSSGSASANSDGGA